MNVAVSLVIGVAFGVVGIACSSGGTTVTGTSDGGSEGGTTGPAQTAAEARQSCDSYLACVQVAAPTLAGGVVSAYGSTSACWAGTLQEAQACQGACQAGKAKVAADTGSQACGALPPPACTSSADPEESAACNACLDRSCCFERGACTTPDRACTTMRAKRLEACGPSSPSETYNKCAMAFTFHEGNNSNNTYLTCQSDHCKTECTSTQ